MATTRRHTASWRRRAAIAAVALLPLATTSAVPAEGTLTIGVITDMSGQYSEGNGPGSVLAARLAVEDFGGSVLGRKIRIISADHQNKPDVAAVIVRQWLDTKQADVIVEGVNSAVGLAIQAVTRERKAIFMISGAGTSELTGRQCSPTSVQWTYDTYASSNATAKAVVGLGGKSWYFLTADYAFGQALERDAERAVKAAGGTVVGSVRHPFGNADFSSFLLQAQASPAQVIALANAGSDFANAIKQANEFGILQSGKTIAALQVTITDIHALGLAPVQGALFTDSWYWDLNDDTRAFSKRFFAEHKAEPTSYQAGTYSAVLNYLKAVQAAGTDESAAVMKKLRETPVNDMFAKGGRVREDGRMVHDMYLMRFKKPSQSTGPWDLYELVKVVPGDEAFRPMSEGGCPYVTAK